MRATLAFPLRTTSNPGPLAPPFPCGSSSMTRYLANLAFKRPKWCSVALFFCVRLISRSISAKKCKIIQKHTDLFKNAHDIKCGDTM
jgi:hypothetical protein